MADLQRAMIPVFVVYIVLLVVGGLIGFLKAGSKVSLISSVVSAVVLALCVFGPVPHGTEAAIVVQVLLVGMFVARYAKTKKFMPSGLLVVLTVLAIVAELLLRRPSA